MRLMGNEVRIRKQDFIEHTETLWDKHKKQATSNGISYVTFKSRIKRGLPPTSAATRAVKRVPRYVWVDDYLDTRKGHCAELGVSYGAIAAIMFRRQMNFEDAIHFYMALRKGEKHEAV